jgi:hypothetical protein
MSLSLGEFEYVEKVNQKSVHFLYEMKYSEFKEYAKKTSLKNENDRKKQYELIHHLAGDFIRNNYIKKRTYKYPSGYNGRLICGQSIQFVKKIFRGCLLNGVTTDIDMKNAHPIILEYICKLHNIHCPNLAYYNCNRDDILSVFTNREEGKEMYLHSINKSKLQKKEKNSIFKKFDSEMKEIQNTICQLKEYNNIVKLVDPNHENFKGKVLNRILCYYENKILQVVIQYLKEKQFEIGVLMFDGLMVYGDYYSNRDLLLQIENIVNTEFENLNMKFDYKEHDTTIDLTNYIIKPVEPEEENIGVYSDMDATDKVFQLYPYWVCCNDILYVFNKENGLWENNKTSYYKIIQQFTNELFILDSNDKKTKRSYGNTLSLMENIPKLMKTKCINNNWINETNSSSLGKFLFNNGYYDLKEKIFYTEFNPSIVFHGKIHFNWEELTDEEIEYMDSIRERLFHLTLGNKMGDYFLMMCARGLAGECIKNICFGLGGTNCGKSIIGKAFREAFGEYVGTFNGENLALKNSSGDEAQSLRWALLLRYKRLIISSEMKQQIELNGNMIKKVSAGSDELIGRGHGKNEEAFNPHFLALCFANDLPPIKPFDDAVEERLKVFGFKKQFVKEPTNEFELEMDTNIDKEIETPLFKKCFVGLIINDYFNFLDDGMLEEPIDLIQSKQDWVDEENNVVSKFKQDFEITDNPIDFVKSSFIDEWIKKNKLDTSMKKFSMLLKKECLLKKYDNVKSVVKKIAGKTPQVWVGIKFIVDTEQEEY